MGVVLRLLIPRDRNCRQGQDPTVVLVGLRCPAILAGTRLECCGFLLCHWSSRACQLSCDHVGSRCRWFAGGPAALHAVLAAVLEPRVVRKLDHRDGVAIVLTNEPHARRAPINRLVSGWIHAVDGGPAPAWAEPFPGGLRQVVARSPLRPPLRAGKTAPLGSAQPSALCRYRSSIRRPGKAPLLRCHRHIRPGAQSPARRPLPERSPNADRKLRGGHSRGSYLEDAPIDSNVHFGLQREHVTESPRD